MVVPTVTNFFQAVMVSLAAAMMTLLSFIPALIGAAILLVVGWLLSDVAARLVVGILDRTGFEHAAQRTGVSGFISRTGMRDARAGVVLAELVRWFIRLIFLEAAAQAVHLVAVTDIINRIILFIPNLAVALVVLMVGAMLGRFVAGLVRGSASEAGFRSPNMLASIAQYAIIAFAVLVAVNQIGIAASLVNTLFMAFVGSIALAAALAFGLGGRDVAAQVWRGWYERSRELGPQISAAAEQRAAATAAQAEPQPAGQPITPGMTPAPQAQPQPGYEAEQRRGRMRPTID